MVTAEVRITNASCSTDTILVIWATPQQILLLLRFGEGSAAEFAAVCGVSKTAEKKVKEAAPLEVRY